MPAECLHPVLPYVCDRHTAGVAWQTAAHCARTGPTGGNPQTAAAAGLYNLGAQCHARGMDDAAGTLLEIEAIKQLKARYCRFLDTKDWQAWRGIFADDFHSDTSPSGGKVIDGADEFVAFVRKNLNTQPTVHQVHAPEIELTSPTTARGIWALNDIVRLAPGLNLDGWGHYHETYEKIDGQWRITSSTLTRLRTDLFNPLFSVRISDRLTRAAAKLARR